MIFFSEAEKKSIESFLAWGSVAYILGFVTVMTHTARLGIPVIEILKPLYIWIGLPLVVVIFLLRWISNFVLQRFSSFKDNYKQLKTKTNSFIQELKDSRSRNESLDDEQFTRLLDSYVDTASLLNLLPLHFLLRPFQSRIEDGLTRFTISIFDSTKKQAKTSSRARFINFYYFYIRGIVLIYTAGSEAIKAINLVGSLLLIPFACYMYIFFVYPQLPQSIGGGKPTPVILMVDAENIPTHTQYTKNLFPVNSSKSSKVMQTAEVDMLYSTSDQYYIRANTGPVIALDKDLIKGIIWDP